MSSISDDVLPALRQRRFAYEMRLERLVSDQKALEEKKVAAREAFKAACDACQEKLSQVQQCEDQLRALVDVICSAEAGDITTDIGEKRARA